MYRRERHEKEQILEYYIMCIRVSFGIYNTEEEIDEFLEILTQAIDICKEEISAFNPNF